MQLYMMAILFLIHLICCIFAYIGIRTGKLQVKTYLLPVVVFVPVWGVLCILFLHLQMGKKKKTYRKVAMGKIHTKEEIYKSMAIENTEESKDVISFEEALLINMPQLRRGLIMDILNDNPREYMTLLSQARMNEDVEVVHYATTAMAELSKEYDYQLQQVEHAYSTEPENEQYLKEYCEFLHEYIASGLVQGQMELVHRNQYIQLMEKRLSKKKELGTCILLVENCLELKDYAKAWEILEFIEKNWPEREEGWLLKIRYHVQQKNGRELKKILKEIHKKNIYFSAEGKELLNFWKQG